MPKTNKDGSAKKSELPSTLERSSKKAQRTYAHTYDAALEQYDGDEERAQRTAWASVKHTHEKVGDHWEPKDEPGPSDERAERGGLNDSPLPAGWTPTRPRSTCTRSRWSSPSTAAPR